MRATIAQCYHTDQGPEGQGVYCGLASEVFLIFTTQINAQLRHFKCNIVND